ncbi:XRE family transcriptional regulator [Polymorphospora rubra]|uniref:XRE family transcriptional regulator n=1 Tax=Polymorphospora rubra TaxID=338584 RepID=UPI001BB44FB3|nr:XRE family transcriptional regulator [Polymorphospora rubra]
METLPAFGVQLMRLAELRDVDVKFLAGRAAVPEPVITAVLDGDEPDPSLLRRLAPALGLHASDVFVIAGQRVPDDLAPLDPAAAGDPGWLAWPLTHLPRAVPELHRFVRSMPQLPRPQRPAAPTPPYLRYPNGAGGLILRLLHNRNLSWLASAKYLYGIGRRDILSASTIGAIGHGRMPLTSHLLTGFAAFLDIPSRDLSALTGIDLTGDHPPTHPDAAEVARLIWNARRLTTDQLQQVHDRAHSIRHERADELRPKHRCSCPGRP